MQFLLILALIIAIFAIIFAVSNTGDTTVKFFGWTLYEGSFALSLIIAMLLGVIISILASSPAWIKNRMAIRNLNKQLTQLQKDYNDQTVKLESTQQQLEEKEKELAEIREPRLPEVIIAQAPSVSTEPPESPDSLTPEQTE